mmetsp:Transcript_5899/g.9180  ORF Transcript_5899/g.9180 Transcript_5899/m.9180 type:complete len:392 (+) Transcript_5899:1063-2238(+)|eukprot:CAMPEP_0203757650 /NCGR_PEP_ID=MMETSP0098-20131031/10615_1 /ASSEMBLY_ACC=CAM_ASM_000208 /TAXON_ID=96639 /ORGANISM=" , Strain NY0313808BC1" /LENGTH=391 /DNA_ID=CAMNT_0050649877 /DNA_START=1033 /DNA_END=2208 /DNA_ORIENTATION=+
MEGKRGCSECCPDECPGQGACAQHFGDLMGGRPRRQSKLEEDLNHVDQNEASASRLFLPKRIAAGMSRLERVLSTANGNLQRIVSSWTNFPVSVRVCYNTRMSVEGHKYERQVELICDNKVFGVADSIVTLTEPELIEAVESKAVGIGQLFRQFDLLPHFQLLSICRGQKHNLVRRYILESYGIICDITENIDTGILPTPRDVVFPSVASTAQRIPSVPNHYGDVMAGMDTAVSVNRKGLSPFERVLATANGNVQRLLSSYLNEPVVVEIIDTGSLSSGGEDLDGWRYNRRVILSRVTAGDQENEALCDAQSVIVVKDAKVNQKLMNGELEFGSSIFGAPGEQGSSLPRFKLLQLVRKDDVLPVLSRQYELSTNDIMVTVSEEFHLKNIST